MMQKGHQEGIRPQLVERRVSAERSASVARPEGTMKFAVKDRWGFIVRLCATLKEAQELARELREDQP